MSINIRPLNRQDFDACWEVLYRYPFAGVPIPTLRRIWKKLLDERRMIGAVVEDIAEPGSPRALYVGATVFVSDRFVAQLARTRVPYSLARVFLTADSDSSFILDESAIAKANAGEGLNLAIVQHGWRRGLPEEGFYRMQSAAVSAFQHVHQGYNLKAMWHECYGLLELEFGVSSGSWVVQDDFADYYSSSGSGLPNESVRPFLLRATKQEVCPATPTAAMFVFAPPKLALTQLQKRLLEATCSGLSSKQTGEILNMPEDNIRRAFRRIYAKLNATPALAATILGNGDKRNLVTHSARREALLNYIRDHKEELRPWPRHRPTAFPADAPAGGFPVIADALSRSHAKKKTMGDWLAGYHPGV